MSKDPKEYLRHIQDECSYIINVSENLLFEDFMRDETLKRASVRSLEIIGEASKKIPSEKPVYSLPRSHDFSNLIISLSPDKFKIPLHGCDRSNRQRPGPDP